MAKPDPCAGWSLTDRLQLLAELAHLPRSLIAALWEAIDTVRGTPRPSTKLPNDLEADRLH